ncbi:MAG: protein kinase [Candidatus Aminicenantes bacterium]|nr:protein kinase [Candidatus Aminicenantes bacterium]
MKCPSCQTENSANSKFCRECATPLPASKPSPPLVTETLDAVRDELTTGSLFAGRYQIIEELGHGGMGRVYRALDKKLNEEVALKLVRPEIAADRSTLDRFHNELKLARKISHPHVGRMYELMEEKGAHFITMEYVPGQDLRRLIRQTGQLTVAKAIAIGKEICEGLAEAHKQAIIHRDLKPSNIIIDRAGEARIMDFGIARSLAVKGRTGAGVMIGTPEYMSPEQVEGKEVDARSDIYSLGIILYEMLTGRVPFEGDTPFTVGVKHKSATPKNPKLLNPHIPDNLSGIVLRCLEKEKTGRYPSAGDLRADLERVEKGLPTTERLAAERKPFTSKEITVKFQPKKLIIPALAIVAMIIAAIVFWPKKASNLDPNLVAVAVFENKTGDPNLDNIGSMAAERIMQGLAQVGGFSVAPMPSAEALAAESKTKDKLRALAEVTKAGKVVHGDYFLQGSNIQFHAWVQDVAVRKNLFALEPASGPIADPNAALEPLRLRLMGGLAGVFDPEIKEYLTLLKEPPNFEAFREYSEGVKAHNRNDYPRAVEHFLRAAERDPKLFHALGHAAVDYMALGQYDKADELLQKAEKSRADASNFERLTFDWAQAGLRGDNETALRATRQLASLTGSQVWIFLHGLTAYENNYPREAVAVLSSYDPYALPRMGRARQYWWALTTAHHMLGNHKQELKEARRGRKQLPENLSMLVREVDALAAMCRAKELQRLFEESKALPPQSGHSHSPGTIMLTAGRELRAHGFREESVRVLNQALQWFEGRSEQEEASVGNRYSQATTLYILGRWAEAKTLFEGLHSEVSDDISYLGYIGTVAARLGDQDGALKVAKQIEEDKRPYLFGDPTYWRARIAALLGDKEGAVNLIRQAIKQGFGYSSIHPTEDFESLADYPPYIQLMKPKG